MNRHLDKAINYTKEALGLTNYYLKRYELYRKQTNLSKTSYILSMEWFPRDREIIDVDLNPTGTACVDVDFHRFTINTIVFVDGVSYAEQTIYPERTKQNVMEWIRQMTDLPEEQEIIQMETEDNYFLFQASIDGITFSPPSMIDVKFNDRNQLSLFSFSGHFPVEGEVKRDDFNITLDQIEDIAKDQCKLFQLPQEREEKWLRLYGMEEVYISNDQRKVIPFEASDEPDRLFVNETLKWEEAIEEEYTYGDIDFIPNVTLEQAEKQEVDPDTLPITADEEKKVLQEVTRFFQREYAEDSGKWYAESLRRDNGYIFAEAKHLEHTERLPRRKINIAIDKNHLQVVNFIDNDIFLEMFADYAPADKVNISKEEAFQELKFYITITPTYVYDSLLESYILCGKMDCDYALHAVTGEILLLDEA